MRRKIMTISVGRNESVICIVKNRRIISVRTVRSGKGEDGSKAEIWEAVAERVKKKFPVAVAAPDEICIFKTVFPEKRRTPGGEYLEEEFADYMKNGEKYRFETMKVNQNNNSVFLAAAIREKDLEEIISSLKNAGLRPVIITPERIALSELLRRGGKDGKQIFAGLFEKRLVMKLFDDYLCVATCEIEYEGKTPGKIAEEVLEAIRYYTEKGMAENGAGIIVYGDIEINSAILKAIRQAGINAMSVKSLIDSGMDIKTASISALEIGAACL
ncbi:MAG: hypothetical protein IKR26_03230 [Lachnospiraceae bacterium]|nr:hypothetical protein [Lachnospiraceae bacterium]